jgi:hypothetical protein
MCIFETVSLPTSLAIVTLFAALILAIAIRSVQKASAYG